MGKGKGNRNMPGKGKAKKTAKITWWVFGGRGYLVAGNAMYDEYDSAENEGRERESVCVVRVGLKEEWLLKRMLV